MTDIDAPAEMPAVQCTQPLLVQVFQNLIGNAIKYARTGVAPAVRITATRDGEACRFEVADNGRGIPAAELDAVFDLFERGSNITDTTGTGTATADIETTETDGQDP